MRLFYVTAILLTLQSLSTYADRSSIAANALAHFKWENRIILCYPKDDNAWAEQVKILEKQRVEIEDRDLVIIRVDKSRDQDRKGSEFGSMLSETDRLAVIKKYDLTPGTSILIGKDGGLKLKQPGILKLEPLFELIDQMPMRKEEMKSDK